MRPSAPAHPVDRFALDEVLVRRSPRLAALLAPRPDELEGR